MQSLNKDFNKILFYKKKKFKFNKKLMISNLSFNFFTKQNVSLNKKKLRFVYFKIFKEFESITSFLPKFYKIKLKYTNKKKKLKTKKYIKLLVTINKKVLFFFDNFFVKYIYFFVKSLEILKKKKFMYTQETIINRFSAKVKLNGECINFNAMILKKFFNFSGFFYKKTKIQIMKEKIDFSKNNKFKFVNLKINLKSKYINFFFNLIMLFIINNYKINFLIYKKYLSKYKI